MQLNMEELKEQDDDSGNSSGSNREKKTTNGKKRVKSGTRRVWDKPADHNAWKKNAAPPKGSIYDKATKIYNQHKIINTGSRALNSKGKPNQNQSTSCLQPL